jgi:hypothetical protein
MHDVSKRDEELPAGMRTELPAAGSWVQFKSSPLIATSWSYDRDLAEAIELHVSPAFGKADISLMKGI